MLSLSALYKYKFDFGLTALCAYYWTSNLIRDLKDENFVYCVYRSVDEDLSGSVGRCA